MPIVDLIKLGFIKKNIIEKFPKNIATKYRIVVFDEDVNTKKIKVAIEDPENLQTQEILNFIGNRNNIGIEQYRTNAKDIDWAITQYDRNYSDDIPSKDRQQHDINDQVVQKENPIIKEEYNKIEKKDNLSNSPTKNVTVGNINHSTQNIVQKVSSDDLNHKETAPDVKSTEISTTETTTNFNKNDTNIIAASDETQDLDKILLEKVDNINKLVQIVKSGSIPQIVAAILYLAIKLEASDVHLEADAKELKLRYRLDGVLKDILTMPVTLQSPIVSRIKILSKLKIDEQRIPQDGRFDVIAMGKSVDLRVSTLPTIHGEKCVMRLLDKAVGLIGLDKLGLIGENLKRTQAADRKSVV